MPLSRSHIRDFDILLQEPFDFGEPAEVRTLVAHSDSTVLTESTLVEFSVVVESHRELVSSHYLYAGIGVIELLNLNVGLRHLNTGGLLSWTDA